MMNIDPQGIFDKALTSDFGIELVLDDHTTARAIRRRLYAEREKFRADGCTDYDCLSFIIKRHDVWVVPRDRLPKSEGVHALDCRPLRANELPDRILSRGRSRVGIKRTYGV